MKPPIITLLTDFGTQDTYVGAMKGVIQGICPGARMVDLTHEVPAQAVIAGAFLLKTALDYLPKGTIHLAVVDPGVGSARKPVVLKAGGQTFVGPDNGLFTAALKGRKIAEIIELTGEKYRLKNPSSTFHGRDIFAPAAAYLAKGVPAARLGKKLSNLIWREIPVPFKTPKGLVGQVLWIDHFGNLVTNFEASHLKKPLRLKMGKTVILNLHEHYAQAKKGELIALIGSFGNLEISVNGGNAAQRLGATIGTTFLFF